MSYFEPDRPYDEQPRFVGEGFRVEPDFRQETGEPEYTPAGSAPGTPTVARHQLPAGSDPDGAPTAAELGGVFDDPQHGEPGRDRFGVHAMWETLLLLALVGVAFATYERHGQPLDLNHVRPLMITATVIGLLALGTGLSLRAGAVNLALGPILVVTSLLFATHLHDGFWLAAVLSVAVAAGVGVGIALVVAGLAVPGWAVSLVAFAAILVWLGHLPVSATLPTQYDLPSNAYYVFGGFAFLAVGGGALGAFRSIRRSVGRFRPVSDPADRRGMPAAVTTALAIVASSVLAGIAGIILAMQTGVVAQSDGLQWTLTALAAALLAGTSVYGRRGGVFGTLLAVSLFTLVGYYTDVANLRVDPYALIGGTLLVGLGVSRLVETYGRPEGRRERSDESTSRWLERTNEGWADQMPTRTYELPQSADVPRAPAAAWADTSDEPWGSR